MRRELDEIHREITTEQQRDLLDAAEAKHTERHRPTTQHTKVSETLRTPKIELGILNPTEKRATLARLLGNRDIQLHLVGNKTKAKAKVVRSMSDRIAEMAIKKLLLTTTGI